MADKVIQVNVTSTKSQRVSVSPGNVQNEITATPDSSQYYSNLAKNWAIASGLILNEDYSSKHYAKESAKSANSAKNYADASQTTYTNVQNVANEALTDIETARIDAVDNITTIKSESIAIVEAKGNEVVSAVNEGIANINTAKTEAVNAVTTTKNNAVTEINNKVSDGKQELNEIIEAGGLNINDKITNCLLEVPQNIKLELKDGVLTLKAGSKVIVPNGAGVFEEKIFSEDYIIRNGWGSASTGMVFYGSSGYKYYPFERMHSGATNPTGLTGNSHINYNTTEGCFYTTTNSGTAWTKGTGVSFPLAIVTWNADNTITSIDQVFNGIGYIGSTIWIDKGVKFLVPNGRKADGTLNNAELTTTQFRIRNMTYAINDGYIMLNHTKAIELVNKKALFTVFDKLPTPNTSYERCYVEVENQQYYHLANDTTWKKTTEWGIAGVATSASNGVISNFQPKLPFRAVDYNDKSTIQDWTASSAMPSSEYVNLTFGASGTRYTMPADGWLLVDLQMTSGKHFIVWNYTKSYGTSISSSATFGQATLLPVSNGDSVGVTYNSSGTVNNFRFIYARGGR